MISSKVIPGVTKAGVGAGGVLPEGCGVQAGVGHKHVRWTVMEGRDRAGPPQQLPQNLGQEEQATEEEGGEGPQGAAMGHSQWAT